MGSEVDLRYDHYNDPVYAAARQRSEYGVAELPDLLSLLQARFPSGEFTAIELGCGVGHVAGGLKRHFPQSRVVATDLVADCLQVTKANYPDLEVAQVHAEGPFPWPEASVEVVFSSNLLEHLHEDAKHCREVCRILKPGGVYYITTPHLFLDSVWCALSSRAGRWRQTIGRFRHDPSVDHCNLKTIRSLARLLRQNGLRPEFRRRSAFATTERAKLRRLLRWLPAPIGGRLSGAIEKTWLHLPLGFQPTIAVAGFKEPAA